MATNIYVSTNREAGRNILALPRATERRLHIHTSSEIQQPWCQK
jgi:hypothetical protein